MSQQFTGQSYKGPRTPFKIVQHVTGWSLQNQLKQLTLTHQRSQLQEVHWEDVTIQALSYRGHPLLLPGAADSSGLIWGSWAISEVLSGQVREMQEEMNTLHNREGKQDTSKKQLLSKSGVTTEHCRQGWRGPSAVSQSPQWEAKWSGQSRCIQMVNMWLLAELLLLWPQEPLSGIIWQSMARISLPPSALSLWIRL